MQILTQISSKNFMDQAINAEKKYVGLLINELKELMNQKLCVYSNVHDSYLARPLSQDVEPIKLYVSTFHETGKIQDNLIHVFDDIKYAEKFLHGWAHTLEKYYGIDSQAYLVSNLGN